MDGFKIDDVEYAWPSRFRLGDPILVEELTGLDFAEFAARSDALIEAADAGASDSLVLAGLVGVAVWQANPKWKREQVVQFVEEIDFERFETVTDDGPPAEGPNGPEESSIGTSDESTSTPDTSEEKGQG